MSPRAVRVDVEEVVDPAERAHVCETILQALPRWFDVENAIEAYVEAARRLETFVVRDGESAVGFLCLKRHTHAAELHVMGVLPERQGLGVGSALVAAAEARLRADGVRLLLVKLLAPSGASTAYVRTWAFYEARGFGYLERVRGRLWGEAPSVVMVKCL